MDHLFILFAIGYQISHRDERKAKSFSKTGQFWRTGHGSIFAHDFAADSGWGKTGKAAQVRRGFCVPRTAHDAANDTAQGEDMARASEVSRQGLRIG